MKLFLNYAWEIDICKDRKNVLITSDHPIIQESPFKYAPNNPALGLGSLGTMLFFPISPSILLIMCDPDFFKRNNRKLGKYELEKDYVDYINHLQLKNANRFLLSSKLIRPKDLRRTPERIIEIHQHIQDKIALWPNALPPQIIPPTQFLKNQSDNQI